jgi:hypothetical protein
MAGQLEDTDEERAAGKCRGPGASQQLPGTRQRNDGHPAHVRQCLLSARQGHCAHSGPDTYPQAISYVYISEKNRDWLLTCVRTDDNIHAVTDTKHTQEDMKMKTVKLSCGCEIIVPDAQSSQEKKACSNEHAAKCTLYDLLRERRRQAHAASAASAWSPNWQREELNFAAALKDRIRDSHG